LALICENPKTTEPILQVEFELVKKFLYYNSDSFSPSFRQCVISSLKKVEFILVLKDVKKNIFLEILFFSFSIDLKKVGFIKQNYYLKQEIKSCLRSTST
jgi:hypothetical protein